MSRFDVVKDGCQSFRYEVWDSLLEEIVAVYGSSDEAEADARLREREAAE